jgi:hypothetical protein
MLLIVVSNGDNLKDEIQPYILASFSYINMTLRHNAKLTVLRIVKHYTMQQIIALERAQRKQ